MAQKTTKEAEAKKAETREMGEKIAALDKPSITVESEPSSKRDAVMLQLPSTICPTKQETVKIALQSAADNPEVRTVGQAKPKF